MINGALVVLLVIGAACSSTPSRGMSSGAAGSEGSGPTMGTGGSSTASGGSSGASGGSGGGAAGGRDAGTDAGTDVGTAPPSLFSTLLNGAPGWHFTYDSTTQDAGFTDTVSGGTFCATLQEFGPFTLGWPADPPGLDLPAAAYQLTYEVWATTPPQMLEVKIASLTDGHADYDVMTDVVGTSPQTFTHTFTLTAEEPAAGIAFNVGVYPGSEIAQPGPISTICFANIGLTSVNAP